ncbi:MAG: RNase adapter RapZ [Actinomycetota bacterium]|nr:RNase adapter RapZ [Actinomycetota bacterium]
MTEYLFIVGMSGAGRSSGAAALEDLGWFVIDNMPVSLISKVSELADRNNNAEKVVFVIGRYGHETIDGVRAEIEHLRYLGAKVRVLFLEATDEALITRFESTRRRHPLGEEGVAASIVKERQLLMPLREIADIIIDTSSLNIHELRRRLSELFTGASESRSLTLTVVSFGFSYGTPRDVDLLFDCRFLPNPHWIAELRPHTGLEDPVKDYVMEQPDTIEFLERLRSLFDFLLPAYEKEGKSYLTVAVGCTGGRHRSVVVANQLAEYFGSRSIAPRVIHRDVDR